MKTLKDILKSLRKEAFLTLTDVANSTSIDQSLVSKIENGSRLPTEEQIKKFSTLYEVELSYLRKFWLVEKIVNEISAYEEGIDALHLAEPRIEYLAGKNAVKPIQLSDATSCRLEDLDELHSKWCDLKPLKGIRLTKMREYFNLNYTHQSNRIEGNTLTLQETHLVVNEGITIGGKSMTEHLEAINHSEAIEFLYDYVSKKRALNERTLLQMHSIILRGINKKYAGIYRDVPVRISGSEHLPAQPFLINKMMEDYFINYNNHISTLHPVILAAEMHERLVSIHPFIDGNGRTSRLIMNLILISNGYTIANLKGDLDSRMKYYKALEHVQVDNDPSHFYHLIIDAVEQSLIEHIELAS